MNLLVVIVVHLLALAAALPTLPAGCPSIVSRDEWGARSSRQITRRNPLSPFLMVHHGGIRSYCTTKEACSRIIRSYQDLHMDDRGWDDIGYSFLIGEDGNIYEGRGWDRIGAHAIKYNTNSIGVCFVGDFTDRLPKDVALQAFYKLVSCSIKMNFLPNNYTLLGHRQAKDTLCPGDSLFKEISQWPNWKNVVPCFCGACWGPLVKIPPRPGHALEEAVSLWLEVGNLAPLEHAVLNGYGQLLEGRTSRLPKVNVFLKKVPRYQGRIARVHEAAATGDLTTLAMILEKPELATSRDDAGSTPVQKAMLANHIAIVRYLLHKSPRCLSATDRMGRTPLHYAAALDGVTQGGGDTSGFSWYQFLVDEGAPEDVEDLLGRAPIFYQEFCEELLLHSKGSPESESPCAVLSRCSSASEKEDKNQLSFQVTIRIGEFDSD